MTSLHELVTLSTTARPKLVKSNAAALMSSTAIQQSFKRPHLSLAMRPSMEIQRWFAIFFLTILNEVAAIDAQLL